MSNIGKLIGGSAVLIGFGIVGLAGWLFYSGLQKQEEVEVQKATTVEVNTDSLATPTIKVDPSVRGQLAGQEETKDA